MSNGIAEADERVLKLNYLDKLFSTLQRVEEAETRCERLQVLLSILLLMLATGLVSTKESLEISSIQLDVPLWLIIGGGAMATGIVTGVAWLYESHGTRLGRAIFGLYSELGYDEPELNEYRGISFFGTPGDVGVRALHGPRAWFGVATWLGVWAVDLWLPVAAQVVAIVTLCSDYGWTWRVLVPLGSALLFGILAALAAEGTPPLPDALQRNRAT